MGVRCSAYSLPQRDVLWLGGWHWCLAWEVAVSVCDDGREKENVTVLGWPLSHPSYWKITSRPLPKNAWSWARFSPKPYRSWAEAREATNWTCERGDKELLKTDENTVIPLWEVESFQRDQWCFFFLFFFKADPGSEKEQFLLKWRRRKLKIITLKKVSFTVEISQWCCSLTLLHECCVG